MSDCNIRLLKRGLILVLLFFTLFIDSYAHPGGHYQYGEEAVFNTWQLKSGLQLRGNFLMSRGDIIYLEQEGGNHIAISLNELTDRDRHLAQMRVDRAIRYNSAAQTDLRSGILLTSLGSISWGALAFLLLYVLYIAVLSGRRLNDRARGSQWLPAYSIFFTLILIVIACSKSVLVNDTTGGGSVSDNLPKTSIGFLDSAFAAFQLSTRSDNSYYYISSNGIPNHNMMIGITSWQQQVPIPQAYTGSNSWSIPLQPVYATVPMSTKTNFMKGAVAIAVNGIPVFNALNNRGEDSYLIGELDQWGGHCGRADDYHYHAAPLHLSAINGLKPIAIALDGFPVFGSQEPDGSKLTGLDTCHGHPWGNSYHYHGTSGYPYVVGAMRGKVITDPATPAPENQILPQAFAKAARPATAPLKNAVITDFIAVGTNGYKLTYEISGKKGYVQYSWDANNRFTYLLTDTAGQVVSATYQR